MDLRPRGARAGELKERRDPTRALPSRDIGTTRKLASSEKRPPVLPALPCRVLGAPAASWPNMRQRGPGGALPFRIAVATGASGGVNRRRAARLGTIDRQDRIDGAPARPVTPATGCKGFRSDQPTARLASGGEVVEPAPRPNRRPFPDAVDQRLRATADGSFPQWQSGKPPGSLASVWALRLTCRPSGRRSHAHASGDRPSAGPGMTGRRRIRTDRRAGRGSRPLR